MSSSCNLSDAQSLIALSTSGNALRTAELLLHYKKSHKDTGLQFYHRFAKQTWLLLDVTCLFVMIVETQLNRAGSLSYL